MSFYHTVQPGEYLSKIAKRFGFHDWHVIYNHPNNAAFRRKRSNPNVIFEGDALYIPDKAKKTELAATGQKHRYKVPGRSLMLKLILRDHDDRVLANEPYLLKIGENEISGETDDNGHLQHPISHWVETAEIFLKRQKLAWTMNVGHLDPVRDEDSQDLVIRGIQQRLRNLGFPCGAADGVLGPKTTRAVRLFQERILHRDHPDGSLDGETVDALTKDHQ